jgi:hypothetical protein
MLVLSINLLICQFFNENRKSIQNKDIIQMKPDIDLLEKMQIKNINLFGSYIHKLLSTVNILKFMLTAVLSYLF